MEATLRLCEWLGRNQQKVSLEVARVTYERHPQLQARYGEAGWQKSVRDVSYHLRFLLDALELESPSLFDDYVAWAKLLFQSMGLEESCVSEPFAVMAEIVERELGVAPAALMRETIERGLTYAQTNSSFSTRAALEAAAVTPGVESYLDVLLAGRRELAVSMVDALRHEGQGIGTIYLGLFQPAQRRLGYLWQTRRCTVAQEHFVTAVTQSLMSRWYSELFSVPPNARCFVAACAQGELHELGLRMVADFFSLAGWNSHYLGANMPVDGVVEELRRRQPQVFAIAATLSQHVGAVKAAIAAIRAAFPVGAPIILVGGYPFSVDAQLWRRVGADGSAADAESAVVLGTRLADEAAA